MAVRTRERAVTNPALAVDDYDFCGLRYQLTTPQSSDHDAPLSLLTATKYLPDGCQAAPMVNAMLLDHQPHRPSSSVGGDSLHVCRKDEVLKDVDAGRLAASDLPHAQLAVLVGRGLSRLRRVSGLPFPLNRNHEE